MRLKNTGEVSVRSPVVAIQLPDNVGGELPDQRQVISAGTPFSPAMTIPVLDLFKADEEESDLFETNGRVSVKHMGGMNPILMPGHTFDFDALVFAFDDFPEGSTIELNYRVDGIDVASVTGSLAATVPTYKQMILTMNEE